MTATDPIVQAVAEALAMHVTGYSMRDGGRTYTCRCGWSFTGSGAGDQAARHRAERAVAAARPLIAAEALREAADGWTQGHWADDLPPQGASRPQLILGMTQRAGDWLRGRADDLEAER